MGYFLSKFFNSLLGALVWICFALVLLSIVCSLPRLFTHLRSSGNHETEVTIYKLEILGVCVEECQKRGVELYEFKTISDLVDYAVEKNLLDEEKSPKRSFRLDGWGHPFRWSIGKTEPSSTVITICSDGINGIPEGCSGDDIYLEIRISSSGVITKRRQWRSGDG